MGTTLRIQSIDILRGLVMIIMALDHTRDFFHITAMTANPLDPATAGTALFFTRWITHFCAPAFVFLSGLSACLAAKNKPQTATSSFLVKRGIWLVIAEIVIVNFGLTFNPHYNFLMLLVFWAIGCSMILLGIFSRLSKPLILITGIILVFGHDLFNIITPPKNEAASLLIKVFFTASGTVVPLSPTHMTGFFYAILPWTGVMFLGYAAGEWFEQGFPKLQRRKNLLISGSVLLLLFFALRIMNIYGDPSPFRTYQEPIKTLLSFLNVSKYPPSLLFCCLTIGPALILLALMENTRNQFSRKISVYGSVPFFYFIVHFYLLHLLLVAAFFITGHHTSEIVLVPFYFRPVAFGFSLPVVYTVWLFVVILLYRPCLWFKTYKTNHIHWWLKYI